MSKLSVHYSSVQWWLFGLALLVVTSSPQAAPRFGMRTSASVNGPSFLRETVSNFDNSGKPLVPTLLQIAETYRVPMGIERVDADAGKTPIFVRMLHGTVAELLTLCLSKASGYAWNANEGVVNIYGLSERSARSNLFNAPVENFAVTNATLNEVNDHLRDLVFRESSGKASAKALGPVGAFGDSPGIGGWETKRFTITIRRATTRDVLNRIVALSSSAGQGVVWVANAPPNHLDRAPNNGLWHFVSVPVGTGGKPTV